jgi:hypothetical protein
LTNLFCSRLEDEADTDATAKRYDSWMSQWPSQDNRERQGKAADPSSLPSIVHWCRNNINTIIIIKWKSEEDRRHLTKTVSKTSYKQQPTSYPDVILKKLL